MHIYVTHMSHHTHTCNIIHTYVNLFLLKEAANKVIHFQLVCSSFHQDWRTTKIFMEV